MRTNTVYIWNYTGRKSNSVLYEIDSNIAFSLTCKKYKVIYAKNSHYGWHLCTVEHQKLYFQEYAYDCIGKEALLNIDRNIETNINDISDSDKVTSFHEPTPNEYQ